MHYIWPLSGSGDDLAGPRSIGKDPEGTRMAWVILVVPGLFEIGSAIGLKYTEGFTRLWPTMWTVLATILSLWLLGIAMKSLPVGTAYSVWVGGSRWHGDSRNRAPRRPGKRGAAPQRCSHHRWHHRSQACNTALTIHCSGRPRACGESEIHHS